jgi:hypothetical protein
VEADFSDDLAARLDAEGRMREVLDLLGQMPRKHEKRRRAADKPSSN